MHKSPEFVVIMGINLYKVSLTHDTAVLTWKKALASFSARKFILREYMNFSPARNLIARK